MPRALARVLRRSAALLAALASLAPFSVAAELRWDPAPTSPPGALADLLYSPRAEFNGFAPEPEHLPLTLRLKGPLPEGVQPGDVIAAMEASARTWNAVSCAQVAFKTEVQAGEEVSEVEAVELNFEPGIGPNAERIAWTTYPTSPEERASVTLNSTAVVWRPSPDPFQRFAEPERPAVDLQAVITHELGHVLGLSHTLAHNAAAMSAAYLRDGRQRTLSADDKLGLCALFPAEGRECARDTDCPDAGRCVDGVCDPHRGQPGDYCAFDLMHCPEFCLIDHAPTGTGYCSEPCNLDADCPTHFACLPRAEDDASVCTFAPSPELDRAPGGCAHTRAPANAPAAPLLLVVLGILTRRLRRRSTSSRR
ncbi:matrixin family metalloprotease [Lujinxingia vulgaris]|uniref:Matrixin family metalloprotease n=1 Tax=Lujinxingia vulgaris TaxID=2600176 RepID=A0A5C6XLD7_9DELT|nr:matrixin family metalloprotease [Lujinxingia vulgaris]TXD38417.1 matrixin family metalloprotease [Lujinxingia vulgaris]